MLKFGTKPNTMMFESGLGFEDSIAQTQNRRDGGT